MTPDLRLKTKNKEKNTSLEKEVIFGGRIRSPKINESYVFIRFELFNHNMVEILNFVRISFGSFLFIMFLHIVLRLPTSRNSEF